MLMGLTGWLVRREREVLVYLIEENRCLRRQLRKRRLRLTDLNQQHLEHVLAVFVAHYDSHRPHRALGLKPPHSTRSSVAPAAKQDEIRVERRDRLGGMVHEYVLAA